MRRHLEASELNTQVLKNTCIISPKNICLCQQIEDGQHLEASEPDAHVAADETSADNTLGLSRSFLDRRDLEINSRFVGQGGH